MFQTSRFGEIGPDQTDEHRDDLVEHLLSLNGDGFTDHRLSSIEATNLAARFAIVALEDGRTYAPSNVGFPSD